ncbi:glycosyl transferase group 1 [[Leptolyngbya] sp. PCC 7376]|uniref:glycosyltransferase n=1 Tax=[Leptolyngbya] sp. PCC 7376 TaxID=111781 RepID=UPI00029EF541|nr:glycosyltransferase [[Leptolyngbya] sp. PCC 7376]AFY37405.1 glycosyl transferase group 1 [[Leptolyngbya] sp. PCC 7376]
MKILHIIPSISADMGGPSQVALNLVKALRDIGEDAEILTTNYGMGEVKTGDRQEYIFDETLGLSVPVWFLPYDPPNLKEFIFSRAATGWMWQNLANYDILDHHYLFSYLPTCAAAIAQFKKIPYTVRTMGQLTSWALAQGKTKKQLYTTLFERRNLQNAAAVHCTANGEAADVQGFGITTPTITLPLGVNIPDEIPNAKQRLRQEYNIGTDTPIILFLSRLHYKKRPDLLLRSLADLKQSNQPFYAIFAGTGEPEYREELVQLTTDLELTNDVIFPGLITGDDKECLLQGADIFALPSYSENFGIAVAEALVVGLPVVITRGIQISPDIEAAGGGKIIEDTQESLTEALLTLLREPEKRLEIGRKGKAFARETYSWSAIAQQLATEYKKICYANKP